MVAGSDRFWLCELRVSQHFSTFYGSSVQSMGTQLNALPALPVLARTVSGCLNSAFLGLFLDYLRLICSVHGCPGDAPTVGEVAPGEMAADALVDITELVGTPQGQGPPPGGFRCDTVPAADRSRRLASLRPGSDKRR